MLEMSPNPSNIHFESATADLRERFACESQYRNAGVSIVHLQPFAGHYPYFVGALDDPDLPSEYVIWGSIEATKLQHRGENLRGLIAQYSGKPEGPQFPQVSRELAFMTCERAEESICDSSSGIEKSLYSARKASDLLRFRQGHIVRWQLSLIHASWYEQACKDLSEVSIEASEVGFEVPEPSTFEHTRNILILLSERYDELPDIQPMEDRSIAIRFENRDRDSSILFVIESDRAGLLIARINGVSSQRRVADVLNVLRHGGYHAMDEAGIRRIPEQSVDI